jgi:hypothetical protein
MTEIPLISITQDDNFDDDIDVDQNRPNINECHTDVEDIDNEHENPMLKVTFKGEEASGGVTDVEDCLASESDIDEPIKDTEISLNEFLDQGSIDESSKTGTQNMLRSKSLAKSPSPSAFRLNVATEAIGGVTDVEDMESSGEEIEEKYYSGDDKPIILDDSQGTDIQDSMSSHRKVSSINRAHQAAYQSNSDSNSEPENGNKKRRPKRLLVKRSNKCEDAKSDVENIFIDDDDKKCKQVRKPRQFPVIDTPDIEVMAFDGSDMEENNEVKIPEINILFHSQSTSYHKKSSSTRKTTTKKSTPKSSSSLLLMPKHSEDAAVTDIENLNSSDDEDNLNIQQSKNFIPIAIMKSDALTDVEDMGDDDDSDMEVEDEKPEIVLPSPLREMTVFCEDKDGAPHQETIPLPDTFLLSVQNMEIEKALTDIEDFSDDDDNEDDEILEGEISNEFELKNYFEMDGGIVESSDRSTEAATSSSCSRIPTKKISYSSCELRQRRIKPKQSTQTKSNFLNIEANQNDALTDVEDMNIDLA